MVTIKITALEMGTAELMLHYLEIWLCHFFNVPGARRMGSWNARATGSKALIVVQLDRNEWKYIRTGLTWELLHRVGQITFWEDESGTVHLTEEQEG